MRGVSFIHPRVGYINIPDSLHPKFCWKTKIKTRWQEHTITDEKRDQDLCKHCSAHVYLVAFFIVAHHFHRRVIFLYRYLSKCSTVITKSVNCCMLWTQCCLAYLLVSHLCIKEMSLIKKCQKLRRCNCVCVCARACAHDCICVSTLGYFLKDILHLTISIKRYFIPDFH